MMHIDYGQVSTKTMAANIFKSLEGKSSTESIKIIESALDMFGIMLSNYMATGIQEEYNLTRKVT